MSCRRPHVAAVLFVLAAWSGAASAATNVALDNILLSKVNGVTTVQIWPACRMRYVDHSPFEAGVDVRIRVNLGPECDALLGEVVSESYAPASLHLGNVEEVTFERFNPRDTFIYLRFEQPSRFEVRQHSVGWIEVYIDTRVDPASLPAASSPPPVQQTAPEPGSALDGLASLPSQSSRPAPDTSRRPTAPVRVPPKSDGDFVVQLGVFDDAERAERTLAQTATRHLAYRTELIVNNRTWYGLQLGFFDAEADAEQVADALRPHFPDAWVRYVDPDEADAARAAGDLRSDDRQQVSAVRVRDDASLSDDQLTALTADGRRALLNRRYSDAIRLYTRVLEVADHSHRPEAREMLGIAFERSGRIDSAIAEYRRYIDEFPDEIGTARVTDRLTALETASSPATRPAPTRVVRRNDSGGWQIHGGVSTYYWRNQEQLVHDGNYLVSSSGVLALGDVSASRRGERFDLLARLNGAYQFNLVEFDRTGDIGWVSNAFVDVLDNQLGLQGRVGRQTRRSDGVIDRFDGIGLRYQWRPDIFFSVSSGLPVDSPRYISDSDRHFYAASAAVEDVWDDRLSASVFTHQQTVDGIWDRQAVGGEVLYRGGTLSVFTLVDFDVSYSVLNSALVNATWHLDNGWSVSGRMDVGAEPYLTTRNALSGQSATSVETLLESFSEGQVRRLARNRTAQSTVFSLGVSAPLGDTFDLSLDATMRQLEATVASGGVAAQPDTGNELFLNATMVATSLLLDNDLLLVSLRYDALRLRDSIHMTIDSRLPITRSLRISPRVTLSHHDSVETATTQTIVSPSVRLMYRWNSILFDLEAGARWSNRELAPLEFDPFAADGTEELLGGFINLGYRWEF